MQVYKMSHGLRYNAAWWGLIPRSWKNRKFWIEGKRQFTPGKGEQHNHLAVSLKLGPAKITFAYKGRIYGN